MDHRGYSARIVETNSHASDSLGVRLGRFCISRDISATEVAEYFKVSKMTIYKWITGKSEPSKRHQDRIQSVLKNGGWV
jgi:hypothetical protein